MKSLSLIIALGATLTHSVAIPTYSGWTRIFAEDFAGSAGSLPSSANWIIDTGTQYPGGSPGWGNFEVETYTSNSANLAISSSKTLLITPRKASNGAWTSGRIETRRTDFAAKSGGKLFIEGRIRLGNAPASAQKGIWPAFWALGAGFRGNYHNWPSVTEWDFFEAINGVSTAYNTAHCGTAPGGPCNEYTGLGTNYGFSRGTWNRYAFQVDRSMVGAGKPGTWRDETLSWYFNQKLVYRLKGATVNDQGAWNNLAHQGHFLLLNVAVGGNWPGSPNSQTTGGLSAGMEVDYVAAWTQ